MKAYYEHRAPEYDDWYLGRGRFSDRDRPGWNEEVDELGRALGALPPARTLDVACGTGFLTRHLRGEVLGLDQSESMLEEARRQAPNATFATGDALELPFPDGSFERAFTAHFYGHLDEADRVRFLGEARRVAAGWSWSTPRSAGRGAEELQGGSSTTVPLGGLQALLHACRPGRRLGGGSPCWPGAGSSPSLLTRRRASYRSIASLQRDNRVCRACAGRIPLESLAVVQPYDGQRAYLFGQAPGWSKARRRPWRGRAGRTLRRWLELDGTSSGDLLLRLGHPLLPGKAPAAAATARAPREQELCAFWRDWGCA